jgi:integrase
MNTSLATACELYLAHNRRVRHVKTVHHYRLAIRQYCAAIGQPNATICDLNDIGLIAMEKSLTDSHSVTTINERVGRVKAIWRWLAQRGEIRQWPTIQRIPEPEPYRRAWTVDQVRRLLRACDESPGEFCGVPASKWWRTWHVVQWETGERTGAMLSLRWEWVTRNGIDIPSEARKGRKAAFYRVSAACMQELEAIRQPARDLVFVFPFHRSSFWNHYERLLRRAGLPGGRKSKPQRMRRTHLTYWAVGGEDASLRAKHTDAETTRRHYLDESILCAIDPSTVLPEL